MWWTTGRSDAAPVRVAVSSYSSATVLWQRLRMIAFYCSFWLLLVRHDDQRGTAEALSVSSSSSSSSTTTTPRRPTTSIGQAIQDATHPDALLHVAEHLLWNVGDADLPPHYSYRRTQQQDQQRDIHHERRQRWSALWLEQWAAMDVEDQQQQQLTQHPRAFTRVLRGVADPMPGSDTDNDDRVDKEGRWMEVALTSLHCIMGRIYEEQQQQKQEMLQLPTEALASLVQLVQRRLRCCRTDNNDIPIERVLATRWAIRGLMARIEGLATSDNDDALRVLLQPWDDRVAELPFDILPQAIHWKQLLGSHKEGKGDDTTDTPLHILRHGVLGPCWHRDTITTRTGAQVVERRATAWCTTTSTIGALAYSGKLMAPQPLPVALEPVLRAVEQAMRVAALSAHTTTTPHDDVSFDAVLCNDYPDATAACKFHTDPEHGTMWHRTTCVVAAGSMRRFAFRPTRGRRHRSSTNDTSQQEERKWTVATELFAGDVVHMWGDCNDRYEHAVYVGAAAAEDETPTEDRGRVSLVLKQALDRGGGRKGHGLPGQGRRKQRQQRQHSSVGYQGDDVTRNTTPHKKKNTVGTPSRPRKRTRRSKRRGTSKKPAP